MPTSGFAKSDGHTPSAGAFRGTPSSGFRLEFFASATADPIGHGQGPTFLGAARVSTDAGGQAAFPATVAGLPAGEAVISATATDSANNTSGFAEDHRPTAGLEPTTAQLVVPPDPVNLGRSIDLVGRPARPARGR